MKRTIPVSGDALKQLRANLQANQFDVEQACNMKPGLLTKMETGRLNLTPEEVTTLAGFYKIEPAKLITAEGYKSILLTLKECAGLIGAKVEI